MRLSLEKMADRFYEHRLASLVVTNMYYNEAPWLTPKSLTAAASVVSKDKRALTGTTSHEFSEQIAALEPFLTSNWQARHSPTTGNPIYERPTALVIYREDFRFLLDNVIPHQGNVPADYDLVIASQPYRARVSAEFKAAKVIAPLARALRPGGRLWVPLLRARPGPGDRAEGFAGTKPLRHRAPRVRARHAELGNEARHFDLNPYAERRAASRYEMHTLPSQIADSIGTSTLLATWNAAV